MASGHTFELLSINMSVYIVVGAFCLPGTGVLNLTGAGLFDPLLGLTAICLSRAVGGLLACVGSRHLFRKKVEQRYKDRLVPLYSGIEKEGGLYLFALRLFPALPFPITNLLMGLTPIRLQTFFWITLISSAPATLVTINAVGRLQNVQSSGELFSPVMIISLALIGLLPLALKKTVTFVRSRLHPEDTALLP
ncbi:MAG: TVP38/TMEM64 family protein [Desulfovibrionales bacterium]